MTYPLTVVPELHIDGAWTNVASDAGATQVLQRDDIVCRWGRPNESSAVPPSMITATFKNANGKFSPRNPTGPYYGKIGRNTPFRVRLGTKDAALTLPGLADSYVSTPDHASLDITGDIDIRIDLQPYSWRPTTGQDLLLASKYLTGGDQRSWILWVPPTGVARFRWSPNGTLASAITISSTVAIPDDDARRAVRVTLDVNNGAAGNDVTFYTAPTIAGSWTQLGAVVTTAGTTSIHSGTAQVEVGSGGFGIDPLAPGEPPLRAEVYAFQILNGIAGSAVANPDFTSPHAGDLTLTDAAGRTWTLNGAAAIVDASVRGAGEVSAWPSRWDVSGNDVWVPIEASGIRRRLGQGAPALRSALYRGLTGDNITPPRGYWPCEDGKEASVIASAIAGHPPITLVQNLELAAFADAAASDAIPTLTTGSMNGRVPGYPASNHLRFMVFANIPDSITGEPTIFEIVTSGTGRRWRLSINSTGGLRLRVTDDDGASLLDSTMGFAILGQRGLLWLYLIQDGSAVDHQVGWQQEGSAAAGTSDGTLASTTKGNIREFGIGRYSGDLLGMAIGHVMVLDTAEFWDIVKLAKAWAGETAAERIARLCDEEDVPLRVEGAADDTALVGPQYIDTFLNLVDAAAKADQGILADDRDAVRLLYRTGGSLTNQAVALTINYATGQVAGSLEPIEDDQLTRNDVTAERVNGSSVRAILESGALSVLPPPNGVGRYDDQQQFNVAGDGQLEHLATWLLHLGTVDEARYPTIGVNLARDTGLSATARDVYVGDRLQVTNPPAWLPPDTIDQLAQGGTEILNRYRHDIIYNCAPASPWSVAVVEDTDLGRADTAGSELASGVTSGATSLSVATTVGPIWVTAAGEMPFDIRVGGEVMRVTAVSGAASPQTFTVVRAVNFPPGVVKAHSAGADVRLAQPAIAAL